MKKLSYFVLFFSLSTLFMGCPYGTETAIDEKPTVKIIPTLLGKWEGRTSTDYTYTVSKTDDTSYKIEKKTNSSGDITVYDGFVSEIGEDKFFNIWEDGSSPKTYYLYKLDMSGGDGFIKLLPVTENIDEKFESSAELKKFIEKYKGLSFFYSKDEDSYIKTGK
jgi:hypothetical protein